mgnify:CR=1 FL=1
MVEAGIRATVDSRSEKTGKKVAEGQVAGKSIKVQYGSPAVKSRTIWGDLVPYNVVWRTGANEATYIDLAEAVTVEGIALAAGKYSIFTIPKESGSWTVIFKKGSTLRGVRRDTERFERDFWSGGDLNTLLEAAQRGRIVRRVRIDVMVARHVQPGNAEPRGFLLDRRQQGRDVVDDVAE